MQLDLFDKYKEIKKSKETERGLLLKEFVEQINEERKGTKFKPVSIKRIAILLSHIPTEHLYYVKSICLDSKKRKGSFGRCFFGSLKVK